MTRRHGPAYRGGRVSAPLAGIRVVDASRYVSGPLCTFFLASFGAEVLAGWPRCSAATATSWTPWQSGV